jgi:hypothetical protein
MTKARICFPSNLLNRQLAGTLKFLQFSHELVYQMSDASDEMSTAVVYKMMAHKRFREVKVITHLCKHSEIMNKTRETHTKQYFLIKHCSRF